jgi:steroid delta-isomerase-like uncharacterized protein
MPAVRRPPMPSRVELQRIASEWVSLWCAPVDWQLFDQLHAVHFEDCSSAGRPPTKAGFAAGLAEIVRAFPDLRASVEQLVVDEETGHAAIRWSAIGTNRVGFIGVGPTDRITPITGIEIIEVRDGQIVKRWGEWDISAHTRGA